MFGYSWSHLRLSFRLASRKKVTQRKRSRREPRHARRRTSLATRLRQPSGPTIVAMEMFLVGPIDGLRRIEWWTAFDLLTIDIEVHQSLRPIDRLHGAWRDQDLLPGPPVPSIDSDVPDAPVGVVHEEVRDMTDLAVDGMDMVPGDCLHTAEVRVAFFLPRLCANRIAR